MAVTCTPEQYAHKLGYERRMHALGYRYDFHNGTWVAPTQPAAPHEEETIDPDDHRNESDAEFESFLSLLKITGGKADPRTPQAQLLKTRHDLRGLRLKERMLQRDVAREKESTFHRRVADVAAKFITDGDYSTA